MRPESRTFEPAAYLRRLRNGQTVLLLLLLLLWSLCRGIPPLSSFSGELPGLLLGLCLLALAVWLLSLAKEGLRYLGFRKLAHAKKEYLRFGVFWSRGGAAAAKSLGAVDARGYKGTLWLCLLLFGLFPLALSLALGSLWLYSGAAILAAGSLGDAVLLWRLRGLPRGSWVQDSPFVPGCEVFLPED